jgi:hypothetical protein
MSLVEPPEDELMASSDGRLASASVNEDEVITKPHVIPQNHLVILRESELACDLSTAIQQVRESEETAGSRILIVAPDEEAAAVQEAVTLPTPPLPMTVGQVARCGGQRALRASAERLAPMLGCLMNLVDEMGRAVDDVADAVQDGTKARLASQARTLSDVVEWVRAAGDDLQQDLRGMHEGCEQVDVLEMLRELAGQVESFFPGVRVHIAPVEGEPSCWANAPELCEALFLGLVLTAHRIGGHGALNLEVTEAGKSLQLRMFGLGETHVVSAPEQMARFRELVVTRHGGRIFPDSHGPSGSGLVVELPTGP